MNRYILGTVVLALMFAMCIPISVFSDDSEAIEITTGEAGISWKSDTLDAEQTSKLLSDDQLTDMAKRAMENFLIYESDYYNISELTIKEANISKARGMKVTDGDVTTVGNNSMTVKMTFKATCKEGSGGQKLLKDGSYMADLIKNVCFDNVTQVGAYFQFDIEYTTVESGIVTQEFVKNNNGNPVVEKMTQDLAEKVIVKGDVKYTYVVDEKETVKEFTIDMSNNVSAKGYEIECSFSGDIKEATESTKVIKNSNIGDVTYAIDISYTVDGNDFDKSVDLSSIIIYEIGSATDTATVLTASDVTVPTYVFYASSLDETPLFSSVNDTSLQNNDALKSFLEENGSIGETYDAAYDNANSEFGSSKSNILLFVGIGVGVVAVVAVGAFLFFRMRP